MFAGDYRENKLVALDAPFPADYSVSTEEYDYLSDSDLDDEEEERTEFIRTNGDADQDESTKTEDVGCNFYTKAT